MCQPDQLRNSSGSLSERHSVSDGDASTTPNKIGILGAIIIATAICSCEVMDHQAMSKTGAYEHDLIISVGGSRHMVGTDGSVYTSDTQASFQNGMQALSAGVGAAMAKPAVPVAK